MARRFSTRVLGATVVALVAGSLAACGEPSGLASGDPAAPTQVRIVTDANLEPVVTELADALEAERSDIALDVVGMPAEELHDRTLRNNNDDQDDNDLDIIVGPASDVDVLRAEQVLAGDPLVFGSDMLVIAAPKGNPADIEDLHAFEADTAAETGVCDESRRCGALARYAFAQAGIDGKPDFVAADGVALLLKLVSSQLDAGLLLRTQAAHYYTDLSIIPIRDEYTKVQQFSIAAVRASPVIDDVVDWLASSAIAGEILSTRGLRDLPEDP
jgi:ABC-type molybdate transport system substrate-binding protein